MPSRKRSLRAPAFNLLLGKRVLDLITSQGYKSPYQFWIDVAGEELSRASLNYLTSGKGDPKLSTLMKVADLLEMTLSELLNFEY